MFYGCRIHNLSSLQLQGGGSTSAEQSSSRINNVLIWSCYWPYPKLITSPGRSRVSAKSCIVWKTWELNWSRNNKVTILNDDRETKAGVITILAVLGVKYIKSPSTWIDALYFELWEQNAAEKSHSTVKNDTIIIFLRYLRFCLH